MNFTEKQAKKIFKDYANIQKMHRLQEKRKSVRITKIINFPDELMIWIKYSNKQVVSEVSFDAKEHTDKLAKYQEIRKNQKKRLH